MLYTWLPFGVEGGELPTLEGYKDLVRVESFLIGVFVNQEEIDLCVIKVYPKVSHKSQSLQHCVVCCQVSHE